MGLNRRNFLGRGIGAGLGIAALAAPMVAAQGRPRVIVVGGGAGGASVARHLAQDSDGAIDIILIEPTRSYYTCFFSNLYLGGLREMATLAHGYGRLAADYGINVVHDWVVGVDRDRLEVALAGGGRLGYDRLVLSPGIDFIDGALPGWSVAAQNRMPHAYKAGSQTELLRAQVDAMRPGGTFALVAPPNPYRCPPGPYERVSMIARRLRATNPTARILIVDPKDSFSKQALFEEGWQAHYPGMIERIGPDFGADRIELRPERMEIVIDGMVEAVDVCNAIPPMKAGRICDLAGVSEGYWAPVVPATMQARADPAIHVLGDAALQGDMPKSAFSANSQARVAAMAIRAALTGARAFPPRFTNTCWSLIDAEDGVKVGATYEATEDRIARVDGFVSQPGEPAALRRATYRESLDWYAAITRDMFG
ncbi:FCSD flavin-binding domain-containing protein [Marinibacterium sp. SX1]|uniref:FCSD flavin-binding domain-containing protein n=1 Tax=Marinibacterium sp. SX1 TaxID=3388424 RepID=UPI003D18354D